MSNHGRHAIVKCLKDSCEYEGRSDNVNRHIKRKHEHSQVVPPNNKKVRQLSEEANH